MFLPAWPGYSSPPYFVGLSSENTFGHSSRHSVYGWKLTNPVGDVTRESWFLMSLSSCG